MMSSLGQEKYTRLLPQPDTPFVSVVHWLFQDADFFCNSGNSVQLDHFNLTFYKLILNPSCDLVIEVKISAPYLLLMQILHQIPKKAVPCWVFFPLKRSSNVSNVTIIKPYHFYIICHVSFLRVIAFCSGHMKRNPRLSVRVRLQMLCIISVLVPGRHFCVQRFSDVCWHGNQVKLMDRVILVCSDSLPHLLLCVIYNVFGYNTI